MEALLEKRVPVTELKSAQLKFEELLELLHLTRPRKRS
jgi:hypothetical protein